MSETIDAPFEVKVRFDRATYRDLRRAMRPERSWATYLAFLGWALAGFGLVIGAAFAVASWFDANTFFFLRDVETGGVRFEPLSGFVVDRFRNGRAFDPILVVAWSFVLITLFALRIINAPQISYAHRVARTRAQPLDGAVARVDASGVRMTNDAYEIYYGWERATRVVRGRDALWVFVVSGGMPLTLDGLDIDVDDAEARIARWRASAGS